MKTLLFLFISACVLGLALDAHESHTPGAVARSKKAVHELRVRIL